MGFDDLGYSPALDRILLPAAQTGALICFVILLLFWGPLLVSVLVATGNLVWYYLALHAGATVIHKLFGHRVLRPMVPLDD